MADAAEEADSKEGLPGWVMTFADLMTLLMCFFVLLLSFSEMDVAKFKEMAGSMEQAFGVQNEIEVKMIPRGTSIIAQEFSPGAPQRTVTNEVRQFTVNSNQSTLDVGQRRGDAKADHPGAEGGRNDIDIEEAERLAEEQAQRLREALSEEIAEGTLIVRRESTDVIVQVLEKDSFASGSSLLEPQFQSTLDRMGQLLDSMVGAIAIAGHTDNVPISTGQFRSNWDLSAMRATTVAHQLLQAGIAADRIMVSGHADTQPRVPNDSAENRALNRRIDITLITSRTNHLNLPSAASGESAAADSAPAKQELAEDAAEATDE
jgi:chemotaxis protein MotB